jgi:CubicO group peptidase (beta-lactamase class C family)
VVIGSDPGRLPGGVTLDNWQAAPYLHWSFQHIAEIVPTSTISRGLGPVAPLPVSMSSIGEIVVRQNRPPEVAIDPGTVDAVMRSSFTDGWMVAHRGLVLAEEYLDGMSAGTAHLLMSVSKSLVGSVAGALHDVGVLDLDQPVAHYVPALESSGYAGATPRHLLDMRSGIEFSEDYLNPDAHVRVIEEAIGWAPRRTPDVPVTMYDYLASLRQKGPHGGIFEYRSCETDVLGWVCEAVTGVRMPELMSDLVWSRLGAEFDASIGVDSAGTGMFDGGICAALRDLVRFGAMILGDGVSLTGARVLSSAWIADTFAGAPDSREMFAASARENLMPGGMYRNQFWFPSADPDVLVCLGIHGQMIYVNRRAEIVAAKLSSWPAPQDARLLFATIDAFDSVANEISG